MRTVAWFLATVFLTVLLAACGDSEVGLSCHDPAPLTGTPSGGSPLYSVSVIEGADVVAETRRMEAAYGFVATDVYDLDFEQPDSFSADLTSSQIAQVVCDDAVHAVYYTHWVYPTE